MKELNRAVEDLGDEMADHQFDDQRLRDEAPTAKCWMKLGLRGRQHSQLRKARLYPSHRATYPEHHPKQQDRLASGSAKIASTGMTAKHL